MKKYHTVLTIAGSDSIGGAGIQADLKTFAAMDCYGVCVITALTAQNTLGVNDIMGVDAEFVGKQINAIYEDVTVDAVKIGMLYSASIIEVVAERLLKYNAKNIILDPVMISTSGSQLLQNDAISALKERLIPIATLITPNLPEAEALSGMKDIAADNMKEVLDRLANLGSKHVLIKGGHGSGEQLTDYLYLNNQKIIEHTKPKIYTKNTHGTGCTLSSAIAAFLAKGFDIKKAVKNGIDNVQQAIIRGADYELGKGNGPLKHWGWR